MTASIMAECLAEARELWEAFSGWEMIEVQSDGELWFGPTEEVVAIAVALYQERMRAQREQDALSPRVSGNTGEPLCPACSLPWATGHVCPAAGSRGEATWTAP